MKSANRIFAIGMAMVVTAAVACTTGGGSKEKAATSGSAEPVSVEGVKAWTEKVYADVYAEYKKADMKPDREVEKQLTKKYFASEQAEELTQFFDAGEMVDLWFRTYWDDELVVNCKTGEPKDVKVEKLTLTPEKTAQVSMKIDMENQELKEQYVKLEMVWDEGAKDWKVRNICYDENCETSIRDIVSMFFSSIAEGGDGDDMEDFPTEVSVSSAAEFFTALTHGAKTITVIGDINLSDVIDSPEACADAGLWVDESMDEIGQPGVYVNYGEVAIKGINGITIRGLNRASEIMTNNHEAWVLRFVGCERPTIENVKIGHTEIGGCDAGVLSFRECKDVSIYGCDLYGCGTIGLWTLDCKVDVKNTIIRECSEGATYIYDSDVRFSGCEFKGNGGTVFVAATEECAGSSIMIEDCDIHDNKYRDREEASMLFSYNLPAKIKKCRIWHPEGSVGDKTATSEEGCEWHDTLNGPDRDDVGPIEMAP